MKWYRGPSKKLLRIKVTSHESELEFNLSPKSTGKYLFDLVCSTIGLRETWYFGLQSYTLLPNGRMRLSQWLKLDKKIVSQKDENGQKIRCFFFHTKFFPEDIEQELIQATTRHLFYLSVKATILNRNETNVNGNLSGDLCPSMDVAILLASLAAQAEYGDVCEDDLDGKDESPFLPQRLLRLLPKTLIHQVQSNQSLAQKLKDCYKSYKGITRDKAELQYLKVAQMHHLFGVDYFPIVCVRMKCPRTLSLTRYLTRNELTPWHSWDKHHTNAWLGVTAAGIQLYGRTQRERPRYTFQWNIIKNVSYRERKFTVKLVDNWQCSKKTSTSHSSSAGGASSMPLTNLTDALGQQTSSQRPRQSSRSTGGRSPLMGSGGPTLTNLNVSSGACGSGASAASLPSTPLSARLMLPAVSSTCSGSGLGLPSSARIHRDTSYERSSRRHGDHSPTVVKNSGRMFKFESGCIPGLTPIVSRCSTNDLLIVSSGACLTAPRVQTTDSSGVGSSASSKSSFAAHQRSNNNPLISVVEVWLADPTQAKTVMSMCAGNHALFMRRRQPDSVEVQQMRAQAREERARREVERSRLARARAEKAEAVEAKLALESKCAQLERALRQQQEVQQMFLSGALTTDAPGESVGEKGNVRPRSTNSSLRFPSTGRKVIHEPSENECFHTQMCPATEQPHRRATDPAVAGGGFSTEQRNDERSRSDVQFNRCDFFHSEDRITQNGGELDDFEEYSWNPLPHGHVCPLNGLERAYPCQPYGQNHQPTMHHRQPLPIYNNGSASTPATPFARRAAVVAEREARPPNYTPQLSRRRVQDNAPYFFPSEMLDSLPHPLADSRQRVGQSGSQPHCFHTSGMAPGPYHMLGAVKPGCYPDESHPSSGLRVMPSHHCIHSPGSLPALNGGYHGLPFPGLPVYPDGDRWSYPPKPLYSSSTSSMANPPFYSVAQSSSRPPPFIHQAGFPFPSQQQDEWFSPQFPPPSVTRLPQSATTPFSTSLSALLSPIAGQRWHQLQLKKHLGDEQEFNFPPDAIGLAGSAIEHNKLPNAYHRSVPFLDRSVSQPYCAAPLGYDPYMVPPQQHSSTAQIPLDWPQLNPSTSLGYSLQHLSDPSAGLETNSNEGLSIPPDMLPDPGDLCARRLTGTASHLWPAEPLPMASGHLLPAALHQQRQCEEFVGAGPYANQLQSGHLPLNSVQRGYLSCRLQEERARFALLQAQFSKQLCDTWACLQVTRSPGERKSSEMYSPVLRNQTTSNELRLDPAGASDGASTGGGCGVGTAPGATTSNAYMTLDQLCVGLHNNELSDSQQPNQVAWNQSELNMENISANDMARAQAQFMDEMNQNPNLIAQDTDVYLHPPVQGVSPDCWCPSMPHLHPSNPNVNSYPEECCRDRQTHTSLQHLHGKPNS